MNTIRPFHRCFLCCLVLLPLLLAVASCGGPRVAFIYPDEAIDFRLPGQKMPALYIDTVTDMRSPAQREGQGHFFQITYPRDEAWEVPATVIYAEALAQDLEQTHLVELVPLPAQADYILSVDLLSLGCQLKRSPANFALAAGIGAGAGLALGDDGSHRVKLAVALAAVSLLAVPTSAAHRAEAEVRMILRDRNGEVVWRKACLGEVEENVHVTATARPDQKMVDRFLTKAVKRANACLLGQLRQAFNDLNDTGS